MEKPSGEASFIQVDSNPNKSRLLGILFLLVTTILWGSTFTLNHRLTQEIPVGFYMFIRYFLGFLGFLPFFHRFRHITPSQWKVTIIAGLLLWASFIFQTFGIMLTSAAKSSFITGLNVIMVPIFVAGFYKQKVRKIVWLSSVLALIGISLMSFTNISKIEWGDVLVLISSVFYALYIIYIEHAIKQVDLIAFSAFQLAVLAVLSILFSALFEGILAPGVLSLNSIFGYPNIAIILYMGFLATSFATIIQMNGQKLVTATQAAIIYALEPIFGALFAVLIGNELLSYQTIIGGILIVGGIFLSIEKTPTNPSLSP